MTRQIGECDCDRCRSSCGYKPGWFEPDEIAPLAQVMGLAVQELFAKHLQIDWYENLEGHDETVFVLSPRLDDEEGGTMFPGDPEGACHWFKEGKCAVHALGKPSECQRAGHTLERNQTRLNHTAIARAWINHQDMIRDLYGKEPEEGYYEGSIFGGLFGSMFR
jgi:hypothetical protein